MLNRAGSNHGESARSRKGKRGSSSFGATRNRVIFIFSFFGNVMLRDNVRYFDRKTRNSIIIEK
jgi:hypothetical protein